MRKALGMTSEKMREIPNGSTAKWVQLIAAGLVLPLLVWVLIEVASMKGNRFTSQDGMEVWQEIAGIRETIAALPPDSFEMKVDKMASTLGEIDKRLAVLEERSRR